MVKRKKKLNDLVLKNTIVSKPNTIWEIDLFYFPKKVKSYNGIYRVYLSIVDSFSKKCLLIEDITNDQSSINIINIVKIYLNNIDVKPKIIHSDYGVQFTSNNWFEFSLFLIDQYSIKLSVSAKKTYNTYATNYFINMCRKMYLNKLKDFKINEIEMNNFVKESVYKYNNTVLKSIDSSPNNKFKDYEKVIDVIAENWKEPITLEQNYIKSSSISISDEQKKELISNFNKKLSNYNYKLVKVNKKQKKPRLNRDIITPTDLKEILKEEEFYTTNRNKLNILTKYKFFQIKIAMILLYLTGCRISEISNITLKDLKVILKEQVIRIWCKKDSNQRIIYLTNKQLLNQLYKNLNNLILYCEKNKIILNNNKTFFFKIKRYDDYYTIENTNLKNSLRSLLNKVLDILGNSKFNKVWSTHSFRYSIITKLIDKHGIEKTSEFIGHKYIQTTQIYYKNDIKIKNLKLLSKDI